MKQMIDFKIIYILAAYDVDFLIPFRIETHHNLKLLSLRGRKGGEILKYLIYHDAKITNIPQKFPIIYKYIG